MVLPRLSPFELEEFFTHREVWKGAFMNKLLEIKKNYSNLGALFRFFETTEGYLGVVPQGAKPGDLICLAKGCDSMLVLRQVERHFVLVGTCYGAGLFDGEFATLLAGGITRMLEIR